MPKLLLLFALALLPAAAGAQTPLSPDAKAKIDTVVNQVLSSTKVPSASIAIVKDGRIAYLQAYGLARLSPPMEATPQMQYSVGSISKQFTAAAVLLLAQEGKLTLDDPVSKYLPDRLSGLLAGGLRDDLHDGAHHRAAHSRCVGKEAA
jgi:CubicO group peptidase (beta-lactamase class C family)